MQKMNLKMLVVLSFSSAVLTGCATAQSQQLKSSMDEPAANAAEASVVDNRLLYSDTCISEREVVEAQKLWGDGIVRIGSSIHLTATIQPPRQILFRICTVTT